MGDSSRPNSSVSGQSGGGASYRYAHPGHDRIAREFDELRQREAELHNHWKEMGFDVPQVSRENETPFSLPEPIRVTDTCPSLDQPDASNTSEQEDVLQDEAVPFDVPATLSSSDQQGQTNAGVKVRPFEDPDDDDSSSGRRSRFTYFPADETPIQREIRLAAEREEMLRASRGLPSRSSCSSDTQYQRRSTVGSSSTPDADESNGWNAGRSSVNYGDGVEVLMPVASSGPGAQRSVSMKQLASSRLAIEIERERQREIDLRRLGCINTISDERACHAPAPVEPAADRTSFNGLDGECRRGSREEQIVRRGSGSDNGQVIAAAATNGHRGQVDVTSSRYSGSHMRSSAGQGSVQLRQTTELIERELREQRMRELELRTQRASIIGGTSPASDAGSDAGSDVGSDAHMTSNGDRRRSALVDQWENRIAKE